MFQTFKKPGIINACACPVPGCAIESFWDFQRLVLAWGYAGKFGGGLPPHVTKYDQKRLVFISIATYLLLARKTAILKNPLNQRNN
jgi:hypothetical protein